MIINAEFEQNRWVVRKPVNLLLKITMDEDLKVGETVEFQFPNSWSLISGPSHTRKFQTSDPAGEHYINVNTSQTGTRFEIDIQERHLNHPEGLSRHGRLFVATLKEGAVSAGEQILIQYHKTFAPDVAESDFLWLKVKGIFPNAFPELHVLPESAELIRILSFSVVRPGQTFNVTVVSLDHFGNISSSTFKDEKITLMTGKVVKEGLNFTGATQVQVSFNKEGVYRFKFREQCSNAVKVSRKSRPVFWGDIHIHSKLSHDGEGSAPYQYAREASALDFASVTDHWQSLGEEGYGILEEWHREANCPGEFAVILGDERNPRKLMGHHNIYFRDVNTFREFRELTCPVEDLDEDRQAQALRELDPGKVMLVPHHSGISWQSGHPLEDKGNAIDWDAWEKNEKLRPLVEIYSHHGQSELYCPQHVLAYEFNRMRNPERRGNYCTAGPYYAQNYWMAGKRIGAIASSDQHSGQGGKPHGGIAAVFSDTLSDEAIFDALLERHCYATTGERILMDFSIAGAEMGQSVKLKKNDNYSVKLKVWGTDLLIRVEIMRHRFGVDDAFWPVVSAAPRPESMDFEFEFEEKFAGPAVYYARITQEPLEWINMAWSSPIWVDSAN